LCGDPLVVLVDSTELKEAIVSVSTEIPGYVAGTWSIDPVHSHINYSVRHLRIARSHGRFESFHGEIVTADNPLASSVTATIDTKSFSSGFATRDEHVRSEAFLDVDQHPTATFRSTGIRQDGDTWTIDGEFTLRGVTKPLALTTRLAGFTENAQGATTIVLSANTTLDRTEFGVGMPSGAIVSEEVIISLEIEATLNPATAVA
jgi:polyisoprenoid-binding protein YceI